MLDRYSAEKAVSNFYVSFDVIFIALISDANEMAVGLKCYVFKFNLGQQPPYIAGKQVPNYFQDRCFTGSVYPRQKIHIIEKPQV